MKELFLFALAFISRCALRVLLPFLPVKKNRILFQSYREKQYSCSPRYICEELMRLCPEGLEIAWSFRKPENFKFLEEKGIRVLMAGSFEAIKYALTARVVCVNTYYKPTLPRRRGQIQLRTWHGGGAYKRVAEAEKLPLIKKLSIRSQLRGANLYLSSSRAFTEQTIRGSFGYKGEVMEIGLPRNDILINGGDKDTVRSELGLEPGEQLVLYAPTYRYDEVRHAFRLDTDALTDALSKRFGGKWVCAFRGHVFTKGKSEASVRDLTDYPDMQKLLLCADALVTDYSSCMWDMSLTGKPVFLYATDLDSYTEKRDFYTDIHTWPFPLSQNNEELARSIAAFDEADYAEKVKAHHAALGSCETGKASYLAAKRIAKECSIEIK